jgi:hypothetical protein
MNKERRISFCSKVVLSVVLLFNLIGITYGRTVNPFSQPEAPFYHLVNNDKPCCVLILNPESSEVEIFAANEIVRYIKKITDVQVEISQKYKKNMLPVYIGKSAKQLMPELAWGKLGTDGFVLRSDSKGIMIAGHEDRGTLYAAYEFIEKYLGVRWFMPGLIGEVIPNEKDLKIGTFTEHQKPSFRFRWIESGDWALKQKMNISVKAGKIPVGVNWKWSYHSMYQLIPADKYFDDHPEWFALVKGQRNRPELRRCWQVCTSNPELIKEVAKNVIKILDEDPSIDIISVCPQDGGGFCECEKCRALDHERPADEQWHGSYSDRLAVFNNKVAELVAIKHPDKLIKIGAYARYVRVPLAQGYKPAPNLAVQVCHTYSCNNHPIEPPTCSRNHDLFTKELIHWSKLTDHLFIYEYYNKGAWGRFPYCQTHVIRKDIPYYHQLGAEGFYTQSAKGNWPSCGLNHYIAAKLLWNVDYDVDILLADFYEKFYVESAESMRDYYQSLENAFKESNCCIAPYGAEWVTYAAFKVFTPEVMVDLDAAVTQAELTAKSEIVKKRISLIRARLDLTKKFLHYMRVIRRPFKNIVLSDEQAVDEAYKIAVALGEPLSDEMIEFCKINNISIFERAIAAHKTIEFIIGGKAKD